MMVMKWNDDSSELLMTVLIVTLVLVYSLTISEVAVTFPTNYVITPILNYPKHVFLHYSF